MTFRFAPAPRRARGESIVPMINVVFLLLVFFLMTSQLVPSEPFPIAPPEAEAETADPGEVAPELFLSAGGEIGFAGARGAAAIAALAAATGPDGPPPRLRADAGAEAAEVARLLKRLAAAGVSDVALVVAPR